MRALAVTPDLIRALKRANAHDLSELMKVANNNGNASQAAWDRITSDPVYKQLEKNAGESETLLAEAER